MPDMAHHLDFILNPAVPTVDNAAAAPPLPSLFHSLPSARYAAPPTIDVVPSALRRKRELPMSFAACEFSACHEPKRLCAPAPLPSLFARGLAAPAGFLAYAGVRSPTPSLNDSVCMATSSEGEVSADEDHDDFAMGTAGQKKKTRLCKVKGCTSLAVSRRSCVRHGGGSRCVVEGCTNGAKLRNRCFQHGGSTVCLAAGCSSKAKRYGYCWSHGGGRICSADGCAKVAAQGGLCWAHGGGNRCKLEGCSKRSYQKHGYYCKAHAAYNVPESA